MLCWLVDCLRPYVTFFQRKTTPTYVSCNTSESVIQTKSSNQLSISTSTNGNTELKYVANINSLDFQSHGKIWAKWYMQKLNNRVIVERRKKNNFIPCLFFLVSFLSFSTGKTFGFRVICAPEYSGQAIFLEWLDRIINYISCTKMGQYHYNNASSL